MKFTNRCSAVLLGTVLALSAAGCANTSLGQKVDDSVITTRVKTALIADPDVKGTVVNVETVNGTVQLSGFVDSPAQISRAADIAKRVDGVTRVENKLSVTPK
jgi:hyperosmotically inducible protein